MNDKYYLRSNIQVEPLINSWYAWIQIIPPGPAAFNIIEKHIKIMQSYINAPLFHKAAINNPSMKGGPFIDLDGKKIEEVRALLNSTIINTQYQADFVAATKELDQLLKQEGTGYSLEPLYKKIPSQLKGLVELYYDRHHRPDFRFFEPLLYKSNVYNESFQSIALRKIVTDQERPFIFSTPRLDDDETINLRIPFKASGLDELFKMKRIPQTLEYIKQELAVNIENEQLFDSFFQKESPRAYNKYNGDKIRIRYFGHACILIESKEISILIDPVLSYTYETNISRYTYDDLPDEIDYVLITHSHHDHILIETLLQIRHKVKNIIIGANVAGSLQDPSLKLLFNNIGFNNVTELSELETINFPSGKITGVPFIGEHHDLYVNSKLCYYIKINEYSILSVADSCNIQPELYDLVHKEIGNIDVLFLGMECDGAPLSWVYGPMFTEKLEKDKDNSRRGRGCNYNEGMDLVNCFNPKEIYVYAMGVEPWVTYILDVHYTDESNPIVQSNKLIETCKIMGLTADRLFAEKELLS